MKLRAEIFLLAVLLGSSGLADGKPYVTEWWRRGVATVRNFILGAAPAPWHEQKMWRFEFDPDAGLQKAPDYQRQFGPRGERLIQLLGSGGDDNNRGGGGGGGNRLSSQMINGRF